MGEMAARPAGDAYDQVLTDLRLRRNELDVAIRTLEAVRGATPTRPAPAPPYTGPSNRTGSYIGLSIADASKKILTASDHPLHTGQIVPLLQAGGVTLTSADPVNTVNSILNRRSKSVGDIVRSGRSLWSLKMERAPRKPEESSSMIDELLKD